MKIIKKSKGVSLIELLVVVAIFATVGALATRSISLTLQGTKKSTSLVNARENLNYSLSIMERQIRGASSIISTCDGTSATSISYLDQDRNSTSFSCLGTIGAVGSYIASGSASLTSDSVKITECTFICTAATGSAPPVVTINLSVQDMNSSGITSGSVGSSTQINLRNY